MQGSRGAAPIAADPRQLEIQKENLLLEDLESHIAQLEEDRSEAELDRLCRETKLKQQQQQQQQPQPKADAGQ